MSDTIIGSVIGGAIASLTAYIVMQCQFKREDASRKREYEKNRKVAITKIALLLSPEIFSNLSNLYEDKELKGLIESNVNSDRGYNPAGISTSEYDALKEEIFKYEDPYLEEVIQVYHIFKLLQRENNIKGFRQPERNRIRNLYKLYVSVTKKSDEILRDYEIGIN